ncbi:MAG: AbrB/MazE/SpoVT family DNA-binding domain-containing protein [Thermoanaerobaculia bacterium]
MKRKLIQIGNLLGVRIPASLVRKHRLEEGERVQVSLSRENGTVRISLGIRRRKRAKRT